MSPDDRPSYSRTLDALGRIKDAIDSSATAELNLPMLCVVGDQTSGKSSLLEALTGVPFPVKSGTCTRMPITVRCRNTPEEGLWLVERDGSERKLDAETVSQEISKAQALAVEEEVGKSFCKNSLNLEARGPKQMELILVDLPGLIHNGPDVKTVTQLAEEFVAKPQALLLLVGEAKQDTELAVALSLATKYDPNGHRTLRVLSKFDTFDSEESRATACNTIAERAAEMLGAHAVVCRVEGAAEYGHAREMESLLSSFSSLNNPGDLIASRLGVLKLKARLPSIFERLIRQNLPNLAAQAQAKLAHAERQIKLLGDDPITPIEMLICAKTGLRIKSPSFTQSVTPAMNKFREDVHTTLSTETITDDFIREHFKFDAFHTPFFQGVSAFESAMRDIVERVSRFQKVLLKQIEMKLTTAMEPLEEVSLVSSRLRASIYSAWARDVAQVIAALHEKANTLLQEIIYFGTQNHYLYDKYVEAEVFPSELKDQFMAALGIVHKPLCSGTANEWEFEDADEGDYPSGAFYSREIAASQIMCAFVEAHKLAEKAARQASVEEHCTRRVRYAVQAHCAVEKKNLPDAMLKAVRDIAVKGLEDFICVKLFTIQDVLANAYEDADVEERRNALHDEVTTLHKVLEEIQALDGTQVTVKFDART